MGRQRVLSVVWVLRWVHCQPEVWVLPWHRPMHARFCARANPAVGQGRRHANVHARRTEGIYVRHQLLVVGILILLGEQLPRLQRVRRLLERPILHLTSSGMFIGEILFFFWLIYQGAWVLRD